MKWHSNYVGLPFKLDGRSRSGVDCYGLVYLVYREVLGIELNPFTGIFVDDTPQTLLHVAKVMSEDRVNWETASVPKEFDMVQLRTGRHAFHVGIALDSKTILHVEEGIDSVVESLKSPLWVNRIEWIYRHPCLT